MPFRSGVIGQCLDSFMLRNIQSSEASLVSGGLVSVGRSFSHPKTMFMMCCVIGYWHTMALSVLFSLDCLSGIWITLYGNPRDTPGPHRRLPNSYGSRTRTGNPECGMFLQTIFKIHSKYRTKLIVAQLSFSHKEVLIPQATATLTFMQLIGSAVGLA